MRILSPRIHGYLDIVFIVAFIVGPLLCGLGGSPLLISVLLGVALLIVTLTTRYPLGAFKTIPLAVHGLIELGITIFAGILPRLGGYSPGSPARSFFWTMAIALGIVWLLTDYREEEFTAPGQRIQKA
jgi:hypothetical protein